MVETKKRVAFIKTEEVMGVTELPLDVSGLKKDDLPLKEVLLEKIVSAFGIDSWEEAIMSLPSIYLNQLLRGEIGMKPPVLLKHNGFYIGTGLGNRSVAVGKLIGHDKILAHVIEGTTNKRI